MCVYIKGQNVSLFNSYIKTDVLMSEVSKVLTYIACLKYCTMNKGLNVMYIEGVESSSIYTIRAVMLCMLKVSKEVQNGLTHLCS